jgi:hypothetical protein
MIVGVSGGVQEGEPSVEVLRAEVDSKGVTMTIHWCLNRRSTDRKDAEIAHPAEVLLVDQFEGEVRFKEVPSK